MPAVNVKIIGKILCLENPLRAISKTAMAMKKAMTAKFKTVTARSQAPIDGGVISIGSGTPIRKMIELAINARAVNITKKLRIRWFLMTKQIVPTAIGRIISKVAKIFTTKTLTLDTKFMIARYDFFCNVLSVSIT